MSSKNDLLRDPRGRGVSSQGFCTTLVLKKFDDRDRCVSKIRKNCVTSFMDDP